MTNRSAARSVRLLYIRDLIRERPRTAQELARLCDVSLYTIYRDLVALQVEPLSVPLIVVDGNKWTVLDCDRF